MSDVSAFSMFICHERDLFHALEDYGWGERLAPVLAPDQAVSDRLDLKHLRHLLRGSTRNNWFKGAMKEILDSSGFERLRFLSEESFTHSVVRTYGETDWPSQLTVVKDSYDLLIQDIDDLMDWCRSNPAEVHKFDDSWADDIDQEIDRAFFTLKPNDEAEEEGQGYHFLFCVLKTVGDLLRNAQHQDFWAIYVSEVNPNL